MHQLGTQSTVIIVAAVILFFLLGIAILVIIDHKAKLPGGFTNNPFSLTGMRRDHPAIAFLTATILLSIIAVLIFELTIAISGFFGIDFKEEQPEILNILDEERHAERTRHFHKIPKTFEPTQGEKNICFYCHGDFPHSKKPMIRSLMNMHTQFTGCMSCHVDEEKIAENTIRLKWLNYSGINVKGEPYGIAYDPNSGALQQTDDFYSRIVAYQQTDGQELLLEVGPDDPRLIEFKKVKDQLSDADQDAFKKRFHKNVRTKGRKCSRCHVDENESYIPFRELGFSEQRINALTNLNMVGLIEKYNRFYITDLMGGGESTHPSSTSSDEKENTDNQLMRDNPRLWWEQMYDKPAEP